MPARATKSEHVGMAMYEVTVSAVRQLTPHLRRVTVRGDGLRGFLDDGPDQRCKLLLPRSGQVAPDIPVGGKGMSWYQTWLTMPAATRPIIRTYTVRNTRPEAAELDLDMLVHEDGGPGSAWAARAVPGDRAAIFGAYAEYEPPPGVRQLIVGDHSALPALAAIVERFSADTRADVIVEVASPDDRLTLTLPAGAGITWLDVSPQGPGVATLAAVTQRCREAQFGYAWVTGDQKTVATIRRHLVRDCGMAPEQIMFMGYWRTDGAIDDLD